MIDRILSKFRLKVLLFMFLSLHSFGIFANPEVLFKSQINVTGIVVASVCSVEVESDASKSGVISFGQYDQSTHLGELDKRFDIKLYESGATTPGCSAFSTSSGLVSVRFGDQGQLNSRGVVVRGAGDNISIAITATDNQASNKDIITSSNAVLTYPQDFSEKGVFGFNAKIEGLDSATPGGYQGTLSVVVSYE
ncbi:fimbrial protein [Vibrio vulnificus]|uniref:fimbrial protein n=1 Tax=Vibrio vulnificus TaxID=672 RepID=UPI0006980AEC|nr:type 1 fimbrial protein [Vibrio vulnificus]